MDFGVRLAVFTWRAMDSNRKHYYSDSNNWWWRVRVLVNGVAGNGTADFQEMAGGD